MRTHRDKILRLPPNRVWRTYTGGRLLDRIEGRLAPADGPEPEDWIGSTVRAINPGKRPAGEGLARAEFGAQSALIADLVAEDPRYFLGTEHVKHFGPNPMVLVKYLDAAVRLPFQVHPTVEFSRRRLNADSGKTEAYYVLETRPEVAEPFIYLGFQRPPTRSALKRMIEKQDIAALEKCFDRIPVKPGDVFVVPGGLPHAIGGGVLMVEVMEPTDFVARIEFEVGGRVIPEPARFMNRDIEFALDMFSFEALPAAAVKTRFAPGPVVIESGADIRRESLVDRRLTDRFRVVRTRLAAPWNWESLGSTILLVLEGSGRAKTRDEVQVLRPYDRILVPHGMRGLRIEPHENLTFLECLPPLPPG
ncbi:MAG: class I mannose-6-phosphate isomerase [Verrucomicrobiota bacterium]